VLDLLARRPRLAELLRWVGYLALSWLVLRPALLVTISGDDLINPFDIYDRYGSNPIRIVTKMTPDVLHNGHFNVPGQIFGAWVFAAWNYLISWGVRYSLIYATTKFVVIVGCALAAGRLLRTLGGLVGWQLTPWRARVLATTVLLVTLQVHVPWGDDPVGSFPLYGYLPAALGLLALDLAIKALDTARRRVVIGAALALGAVILYYELNVAVLVALVPAVVLLALRTSWRPVLTRFVMVAGPATVMTLVLFVVAKRANRGYSGTAVDVGGVTGGLVVRTVGGSLPASAWSVAHDWLGGSFGLRAGDVVIAVIVGVAVCLVAWWPRSPGPTAPWWSVALAGAVPVTLWLAATIVQTVTSRVDVATARIGFVYTYYAYGSVGVALGAILLVQVLPRPRWLHAARPVLVALAVAFVVVQISVNTTVVRAFDQRFAAIDRLVVAASSQPPEPERCAALADWLAATPFQEGYYHRAMIDGLNVTFQDRHGELFCTSDVARSP
jgi:hypothetical protein